MNKIWAVVFRLANCKQSLRVDCSEQKAAEKEALGSSYKFECLIRYLML